MPIYAASHLAPVASPPLRDAAVWVGQGRILAVGPRAEVLSCARLAGDHDLRELGDAVILPGLVNAHTHLELSWMAGRELAQGDYSRWVGDLLALRQTEDPRASRAAAEREIAALRRRGTVAVGDIGNATWIVPLLARSDLHVVAFHELLGLRPQVAEERLARGITEVEALTRDPACVEAATRCRVVLTPHAPHTTAAPLLRALAARAAAAGDPLSIHVAESTAEVEWLTTGRGPLAQLFRAHGFTDPGWTPPSRTPVDYLDELGLLSRHTLAVHAIHLTRGERARLRTSGATLVTCPRSNRRLGVGRAPVAQWLREGLPVALGTDSLASCPDLDLFAEMAALCQEHPRLEPAAVLRMATWNGARALGLADRLGSIESGKLADLLVVPLDGTDDPLARLCSNPDVVFPLDRAPERSR